MEYYLTCCGVVVPLLAVLTCFEARKSTAAFRDLPDVQDQIINAMYFGIFIALVSTSMVMSLIWIVGAIVRNRNFIEVYRKI